MRHHRTVPHKKTVTGRIWTYVRDDRPFGGHAPPAALYYASRDRKHEHPVQHLQAFTGILQADAYSGYNELYDPSRSQGAITAALCWAHARRQFFELADIAANARRGKNAAAISPVALAAVKRIDALFDIETRHQRPKHRPASADAHTLTPARQRRAVERQPV